MLFCYSIHHSDDISNEGRPASLRVSALPGVSFFFPSFFTSNLFPFLERFILLSGFKFHITEGPTIRFAIDSVHEFSFSLDAHRQRCER